MNRLFSLFLIFCFISTVELQSFAQDLSKETLTQPNKPNFRPEIKDKKFDIPKTVPLKIKTYEKSQDDSFIINTYPILTKRMVKTTSSDKYIKNFVKDIHRYWIPPVTDTNIIIEYEVVISKNKIVKRDITYSNTTKEIEALADEAIKKAEVYLSEQRKFFKRTMSFKIYFTQNIEIKSHYKKLVDMQPSPILSGPIPNLKPVPFTTSQTGTMLRNNFAKIPVNQISTVTYEPNIIAHIYEYDSSIDMNYVKPSVTVHRAYDVKNKECYVCRNLENMLVSNWFPVQDSISRNVIFKVDIAPDNSFKYSMQASSSDPSVDNAALLSLYNTKLSGLYGYNSGTYVVTYHSGPPEQPDFNTYLRNLSNQLKDKWKPYSQTITTPVEILIAISDKGDIFSWNIIKSSGLKKQDDSVINSILLSMPVKKLPEKYRGEYVKVKLTYQMNKIANVINMMDESFSPAVSKTSTQNQKNTKEPDFGPYMRELQRRVKMNWDPPRENKSKQVVLIFRIAKDGRLLSHSIFKSSGSQNVDGAALRAVRLAAPFKPLPSDYLGDFIDIQFTFDYNVYGAPKY